MATVGNLCVKVQTDPAALLEGLEKTKLLAEIADLREELAAQRRVMGDWLQEPEQKAIAAAMALERSKYQRILEKARIALHDAVASLAEFSIDVPCQKRSLQLARQIDSLHAFLATEEIAAPGPGQEIVAFVFRSQHQLSLESQRQIRTNLENTWKSTKWEHVPIIALHDGDSFEMVTFPPRQLTAKEMGGA